MKEFSTIELDINKKIATIWLNRTEVHNAFNEVMISELMQCFNYVEELKDIRVIVLRGKGKSFCSGADLQWMAQYNDNYEVNLADSVKMAACFHAIYKIPKPTIAIVHGTVFGGANGLMCACDIAIAAGNTRFSFPELRIGLVPSTILPYVLQRINAHKAKLLMYTGKIIDAREALELGLIDELFSDEIEKKVHELIDKIIRSGPDAITECKSLINHYSGKMIERDIITHTAESITKIKMSQEGQEGTSAFFEKRAPDWTNLNR
jgi:methylglutaconyl-CoA hydratase